MRLTIRPGDRVRRRSRAVWTREMVGVAAQQALVREQDDNSCRPEVILDGDERLLHVAHEAADVADDEDVESATASGIEHRLPYLPPQRNVPET